MNPTVQLQSGRERGREEEEGEGWRERDGGRGRERDGGRDT